MDFDPTSLYSDLAQDGPPLFFPDPPVRVTFNFDQGVSAEETFPIEDFKRLAVEVLEEDQGRALEYISFEYDEEAKQIVYISSYDELVLGYRGLRDELAPWVSAKNGGRSVDADNFILTSGSVQGIALAVNAFVNAGDGVIAEASSFPYALRYIDMRKGVLRTVPVDRNGIDVDAVEATLQRMSDEGITPKLLYTIPTFQLPTGVCTSVERRRRLIELAREWRFVIIEDNVYGDLRFEGEELPTLFSMDDTGLVIQAHTFSKIVAPALRLGWMVAEPEMIAGMAAVRQDLGVSQWMSRIMARWMAEGHIDDHIRMANGVYRQRRDVAARAVRQYCGDHVSFDLPEGGFYLWLKIADGVDWEAAQHDAAMAGVFCRPGEVFMGDEAGERYMRLAYCHVTEDEIERGIAELGRAIHDNTTT